MWVISADTASALSALASLFQAALLVVSILYLNRQFGILRACSYIERFNSGECIRRRAVVDGWLRERPEQEQRIRQFQQDPQLQGEVLGFMNLFQELGVAYVHHNVHKQTVRDTFDFLVPYYWRQLEFMVRYLRAQRDSPAMYGKFELMATALSAGRRRA